MNFGLIPVAEASVVTLMKSINRVIINPIIFFLFALAMVYFLYGVAQYYLNSDNEEVRNKSKSHMLYGVFGLFIMVAVFGIMRLILNTVGEENIHIADNGDYEITSHINKDNIYNLDGAVGSTLDPTSMNGINLTTSSSIGPTDFSKSPFKIKYADNPLCWHQEVHGEGNTVYKALQVVKTLAKEKYSLASGFNIDSLRNMPISFGQARSFDKVNKRYHIWMDARGPINDGNIDDCVLKVSNKEELALNMFISGEYLSTSGPVSDGPSPLSRSYTSDLFFYRVQASGVNILLQVAREIAIKNAYFLLFGEYLNIDINDVSVVYPTFRILEEKYLTNPITGKYEYWVAIESSKDNNTGVNFTRKTSPFTITYLSNILFSKVIDSGISKNLSKARSLAINNALLKLSLGLCNNKKDDDNDGFIDIADPQCHLDGDVNNAESYIPYSYSESIIPKIDFSTGVQIGIVQCNNKKDDDGDGLIDLADPNCHTDNNSNNVETYIPYNYSESISPKIDISTGINFMIILEEKKIYKSETGEYKYWVAVENSKITKDSKIVSQSLNIAPFTKTYNNNESYYRAVSSGVSKDLATAKDLAINNALIKISLDVKDSLTGVKFVDILEGKQVFNSVTGNYEYWVALEASKTVDGSSLISQSTKSSPFTQTYQSNELYYRAVSSGVSKDLVTAKDLAISNVLLELSSESGTTVDVEFVNIIDESYYLNSSTGNYEYWVAVESSKNERK